MRLVVARSSNDPSVLRREVDRLLRTRRFLDYTESIEWATAAQPVVAELELLVHTAPSRQLIELLRRAITHVVSALHHADDSSGSLGGLVDELLELHAVACEAGAADPIDLAQWMVRFAFIDQDWFEVDPVRYADALGDTGLAAYREAVANAAQPDSFAVRNALERLAILDQDLDAIVELVGGDLRNSYQFARVAEAMAELGREDLVLEWAQRGIAETDGWQIYQLYDIACEVYVRREEPLEVLRIRRAHHERVPTVSTYATLRAAAEAIDAWEVERDAARAVLERRDVRGYVSALLADGDVELAWDVAVADGSDGALGPEDWLDLAEARESSRPDESLAVYLHIVDDMLERADRRVYTRAAKILKRARSAAQAATRSDLFDDHVGRIRDKYRRRPSLIAILDRGGFV